MVMMAILADVIAPDPNVQNPRHGADSADDKAVCWPFSQDVSQERIYLHNSLKRTRYFHSKGRCWRWQDDRCWFKKTGDALLVLQADGNQAIKAIAPNPSGTISPTDKILGKSDTHATFVSARQVTTMVHFTKFKAKGENTKPSRESIGAELVDVEQWKTWLCMACSGQSNRNAKASLKRRS